IGENDLIRLGQRPPMAALAGVGSYGIVFHTKIARSSRRACNFMTPKGECAPAVFSIPIARSNSRCLSGPCVVLGRDLACRPVPTVSMRANARNPPCRHRVLLRDNFTIR